MTFTNTLTPWPPRRRHLVALIALAIAFSTTAKEPWQTLTDDGFGQLEDNAAITAMHATTSGDSLVATSRDGSVEPARIYRITPPNSFAEINIPALSGSTAGTVTGFASAIDDLGTAPTADDIEYTWFATANPSGGTGDVYRASGGDSYIRINTAASGFPQGTGNESISALFLFDNDDAGPNPLMLYVGTSNTAGGQLWRTVYNDADYGDSSWEKVLDFADSATDGSFDLIEAPNNSAISQIIAFNGHLYIGTENFSQGTEIHRSSDGEIDNWTQVASGLGGAPINYEISAFLVHKDELFAGTRSSSDGAAIFRTIDGTNWAMATLPSFGVQGVEAVSSLVSFRDGIWAALSGSETSMVWRSFDQGNTFSQSNHNGFDDAERYTDNAQLAVFGNRLYWGGENPTDLSTRGILGAQVKYFDAGLGWSFEEGTGNTVGALGGDGDLAVQGRADWRSSPAPIDGGQFGMKVTGQSLALPVNSLPATATTFTIGMWFCPTDTASGILFDSLDGASGIRLELDASTLKLSVGTSNDQLGTTSLTEDQWYHVAIVANGTDVRVYLNGTEKEITESTFVPEISLLGSVTAPTSPALASFGSSADGGSGFLQAFVDEFRFYEYDLTLAEIRKMGGWHVFDLTDIEDALTAPEFQDGDTIVLAPGSYSGSLSLGSVRATLVGSKGAEDTVIDAVSTGRPLEVTGTTSAATIVKGVKLTGGSVFGDDGGGIKIGVGAGLTVRDCIIAGNIAIGSLGGGSGGGIFVASGGTLQLEDSVVSDNIAEDGNGGGIAVFGDAQVERCMITGNRTQVNQQSLLDGGGIFSGSSSILDLTVSKISGNKAVQSGGGLAVAIGGDSHVGGCEFVGNYAGSHGGGVFFGLDGELINCSVSHNEAASEGGGLWIEQTTESSVANCMFLDNVATAKPQVRINELGGAFNDFLHNAAKPAFSFGVGVGPQNQTLDPKWLKTTFSSEVTSNVGFDAESCTTDIEDVSRYYFPDRMVGRYLRIDNGGALLAFPIVANTRTELTVVGDLTSFATAGSFFEIVSPRMLSVASNAHDAGTTSVSGIPASDIDGEPRIQGTIDIGADELADADSDMVLDTEEEQFSYGEGAIVGSNSNNDFDLDGYDDSFEAYHDSAIGSDLSIPAATIHVATTGDDTTGDGSFGNPYATIAKALSVAQFRDVIELAAGRYQGAGNVNVVPPGGMNVAIRGEGELGDVVIDGGGTARAFDFANNTVVRLINLMFENCVGADVNGSGTDGGALLVRANVGNESRFANLRFVNCSSPTNGGAISAPGPNAGAMLENCEFSNNSAGGNGGAVSLESGALLWVMRGRFLDNIAGQTGGAIYVGTSSNSNPILNCQIGPGNSALNGGGVATSGATGVQLWHCTIAGNTASGDGGGLHADSGGSFSIQNSVVGHNAATGSGDNLALAGGATISSGSSVWDADTPTGGTNLTADPAFVDPLHDLSLRSDSPAIDHGSLVQTNSKRNTLIQGDIRGAGLFGNPDAGCYEFAEICVDAVNGDDATGDGSEGAPFATIQRAVDEAVEGTTIRLKDGVYTGPGNIGLKLAANVVIIADNGPDAVTIDCDFAGRAFVIDAEQSDFTQIVGITFTNGSDSFDDIDGGFLLIDEFAEPTFHDCRFIGGFSFNSGGAVAVLGRAFPRFEDCLFASNQASSDGGSIVLYQADADFRRCVITSGVAGLSGGGLAVYEGFAEIENSVIVGNEASNEGGGIFCGVNSSIKAVHNTIIRNSAFSGSTGGSGVFVGSLSNIDGAKNLFRDNPLGGPANDIEIFTGGTSLLTNSFFGPPGFVTRPGGTSSVAVDEDFVNGTFTITDAAATLIPGELRGTLLNPDTGQDMVFPIISNTETQITAIGISPSGIFSGTGYQVEDFRLSSGSAARDDNGDAGVSEDIDLQARDATPDIGADEATPVQIVEIVSLTPDGDFTAGATIEFEVRFDRFVTVANGAQPPQITLETGASDRVLDATPTAGGDRLHFSYTVMNGEETADLDVVPGSFTDNSSTITDAAGMPVDFGSEPTPGGPGSLSAKSDITIDAVPPAQPGTPDLAAASDTGASDSDNVTKDNLPIFTGTAEPFATIELVTDRGGTVDSTTADNSGNWSIEVNGGSLINPLPEGVNVITVTATDALGNTSSPSSSLTVTIDTGVPASPIFNSAIFTGATDSGPSNTDGVTNVLTPTVEGTAETGSLVRIFSSASGATVLASSTAGGGTFSISTTLSQGSQDLSATAEDLAGNVSIASPGQAVVIDQTAPTLSCPTDLTVECTVPAALTNVGDFQTAGGTISDNDTVDGSSFTHLGDVTDGQSNPETITRTYRIADVAGNVATCQQLITVQDTTDPVVSGCPGDITVNADAGTCGAVVTFNITASDNCDGTLSPIVFSTPDLGLDSGSVFPVGTTTITYQFQDSSNNIVTCDFDVTVNDAQVPEVNCAAVDATFDTDPDSCTHNLTTADFSDLAAEISFNDNCSASLTYSLNGDAAVASLEGLDVADGDVVTVIASDGVNTATCNFTISLIDNQDPAITCPADEVVDNDPDQCGKTVFYTEPTATDNCPGVTVARTAGPGPGSLFPIGTTTVTYTATDAAGNSSSCSFDITVEDNEDPVLSCPDNITEVVGIGDSSGAVTFTVPPIDDNCPGGSVSVSTAPTAGLNSGDQFPVGTTTVTLTATDAAGNVSTCSFTVEVANEDPAIISDFVWLDLDEDGIQDAGEAGVADITVRLLDSGFSLLDTTITDADGLYSFTVPAGDYIVEFVTGIDYKTTQQDQGADDSLDSDVDVNGFSGLITVAAGETDDTVDAGLLCNLVLGGFLFADVNNDGVFQSGTEIGAGSGVEVELYTDDDSNGAFSIGDSLVTSVITSRGGEYLFAGLQPGDYLVVIPMSNFDSGPLSGMVSSTGNDPAPDPDDNLDDDDNGIDLPGRIVASSAITLVRNAEPVDDDDTDACTNFTVDFGFIVDSQGPTITCPPTLSVQCVGDIPATFADFTAWVTAGGTATDAAGIDEFSFRVVSETTDDNSCPETLTCTYGISDTNGNESTCTQLIVIDDDTAPTLSCPDGLTAQCPTALPTAYATLTEFESAGGTATDNCGLDEGSFVLLGESTTNNIITRTYQIADLCGNLATCQQTITVNDTIPPVIACPSNISVSNDPGICGAVILFSEPVGTDNCTGVTTARTAGPGPGSTFAVGTTEVTYTATDAAGNQANCTFTVTVFDDDLPTIGFCPENIAVGTDAGTCGAVVTYDLPTATNGCDGDLTAVLEEGLVSGAAFPLGSTTVEYSFTGTNGLQEFCSFEVTVTDDEAPTITCPDDIVVVLPQGTTETFVNIPAPTVDDNCDTTPTITHDGDLGAARNSDPSRTFTVGTPETVTFFATDAAGNQSSCTLTVTVSNEPPATIGDFVWHDLDGDGIQDAGEPGLDGITVSLLNDASGSVVASTTTGTDGSYQFSEAAGTYRLEVQLPTSFTATLATAGTDTALDNDLLPNGESAAFTVASDETRDDLDLGLICELSIGGIVFSDLDLDDSFNNSDTPDANVLVQLWIDTDASGALNLAGDTLIDSTTTASDGTYVFNDLLPGNYFVVLATSNFETGAALAKHLPLPNPTPANDDVSLDNNGGAHPAGVATGVITLARGSEPTSEDGNDCTNLTIDIGLEFDDSGPILSCPDDLSLQCLSELPDAYVSLAEFLAAGGTAEDAGCGLDPDSFTATLDPVTVQRQEGLWEMIVQVADTCGNVTSCSQIFFVDDTTAPVIQTCVQDQTLAPDAGLCTATVPDLTSLIVASDNCDAAPSITQSPAPGSGNLGVGPHIFTFTVTDADSNVATCQAEITVAPQTLSVTCVDVTKIVPFGDSDGSVTVPAPTITGGCGTYSTSVTINGQTIAGEDASGIYDVGTHTVIYTVTDGNGGTATCTSIVTVLAGDPNSANLVAAAIINNGTPSVDSFFDIVYQIGNDGPLAASGARAEILLPPDVTVLNVQLPGTATQTTTQTTSNITIEITGLDLSIGATVSVTVRVATETPGPFATRLSVDHATIPDPNLPDNQRDLGLTVEAGAPAALAFIQQPVGSSAGKLFAQVPQVVIVDQFGNGTVGSVNVTLGISNDPNGGLSQLANGDATISSASIASFDGLRLAHAGQGFRLRATATGLAAALSDPFDVAAASLAILTLPDGDAGALKPLLLPNSGVAPEVVATGDFDGDDRDELLIRDPGDQSLAILDPVTNATTTIGLAGYGVYATGDFNGDGNDDLLVGANGTGTPEFRLLNGGTVTNGGTAPIDLSTTSIDAVGDLNKDGADEIILRQNSGSRPLSAHFFNDSTRNFLASFDGFDVISVVNNPSGTADELILFRLGFGIRRAQLGTLEQEAVDATLLSGSLAVDESLLIDSVVAGSANIAEPVIVTSMPPNVVRPTSGALSFPVRSTASVGLNFIRLASAGTTTTQLSIDAADRIQGVGDFDGDGRADVLLELQTAMATDAAIWADQFVTEPITSSGNSSVRSDVQLEVYVPGVPEHRRVDRALLTAPATTNHAQYPFYFSASTVTLAQFIDFLNIERAKSTTDLHFMANGNVRYGSASGVLLFEMSQVNNVTVSDNATAADFSYGVGVSNNRYTYSATYASAPAIGVTWFGAAKYCNWLASEMGLADNELAFSEGQGPAAWRPAHLSAADWNDGFDDNERLSWLMLFPYSPRLPMNDNSTTEGAFNEFHAAAAPNNETFGTAEGGNHWNSGDIFDNGPTPNSYYAPNAYGLYDMSGNAWEWQVDTVTPGDNSERFVQGGSWFNFQQFTQTDYGFGIAPNAAFSDVGFRSASLTGSHFQVEVSVSSDFSSIVSQSYTSATEWTPLHSWSPEDDLATGTTYFWRYRWYRPGLSQGWSDWRNAGSFTTSNQVVTSAQSLPITSGWNLVSLCLDPKEKNFKHEFGMDATAWAWDPFAQQYVLPAELNAYQGFWLYAPTLAADAATRGTPHQIAGYTPVSSTVTLRIGWNLVGPGADNVALPTNSVIRGKVRGFENNRYFTAEEELRKGLGYWIFSTGLTQFSATAPATTEPPLTR